jgi:phosphoribosylformylglycinamidine cyclo-ligase
MDYHSSGVSIDAGNRAVGLIKSRVAETFSPFVLNGLGGFASCFQVPPGYREPVLVSCTDGVGTKLKIAIDHDILETVGIDLVAMCVNDMICCGAKPLFFLDYIACHQLIPEQMKRLIDGMVDGCKQAGCALTGGEMAEMNDLYRKGDFDLAGFSVGIVEKSLMLDGSGVRAGHYVYALPSSGVHSNGFSLVRKVLTPEVCAKRGLTAKDLLVPTRIYVTDIMALLSLGCIQAVSHITGGGLVENVSRVLPKGVALDVDWDLVRTPAIFSIIQEEGNVSTEEMRRVFNMGVGMVVVSSVELPESERLYRIGRII